MEPLTEEKNMVQERMALLPKQLQSILLDDSFGPTIAGIAETHDLTKTQAVLLENEVAFVILGFTLRSNFMDTIREVLEISETKAEAIEQDVGMMIFGRALDYIDAFEYAAMEAQSEETIRNVRDKLELMPEGARLGKKIEQADAEPISKDALIGSLKARRTMAGDMEAARRKDVGEEKHEQTITTHAASVPENTPHAEGGVEQSEQPPKPLTTPRTGKPLTDMPKYDDQKS